MSEVAKKAICAAHRLSKRSLASAVIVRMNNLDKKTQIINDGKKQELQTKDVGYRSKNRIYVSKHLTKETTELLMAAKEKLKVPVT